MVEKRDKLVCHESSINHIQLKPLILTDKTSPFPRVCAKPCTYIENGPVDLAEDACEAPPARPGGLRRPEGQRDQQEDVRDALVEDEGVGHGPGGLPLQTQGGHEESVPQQAQHGQQPEPNLNPGGVGMSVIKIVLVLVVLVVIVAAIQAEQSVEIHVHSRLQAREARGQARTKKPTKKLEAPEDGRRYKRFSVCVGGHCECVSVCRPAM